MDVSSAGSVGGTGPVRPVQIASTAAASPPGVSGLEAPRDEVEISSAARLLDQIQCDPAVRAERLAEIRAAITAGTYETTEKLEAAIERMLDEIRRSGH